MSGPLRIFQVELTLRYTRYSCRPYRATARFERCVQATDPADAVRQGCLCLDRDLEEVLAAVNASNVSEVLVEVGKVGEPAPDSRLSLWNPEPFPASCAIPPHIVVRP